MSFLCSVSHIAAQTALSGSGAKAGAGLYLKSGRGCIRFVFVSGGRASTQAELMPSARALQRWHRGRAKAAAPGLLPESPSAASRHNNALCQGC